MAVDAAAAAFTDWSKMPGIERGCILGNTYQLMMARCDDLARMVTQDNGKPFEEARKEVSLPGGYFACTSPMDTLSLPLEALGCPLPERFS